MFILYGTLLSLETETHTSPVHFSAFIQTRSLSETAMCDLSNKPEDTKKMRQVAACTGEGNSLVSKESSKRSSSISSADQSDHSLDDEGQVCPRASSWSHHTPAPSHATLSWPHCGHRLAIAVHSNTLHDVDGRKVIIIQSKRSAASSRRPLQVDDDFDPN